MPFKLEFPAVSYEFDESRQYDFLTVFTANVRDRGIIGFVDGGYPVGERPNGSLIYGDKFISADFTPAGDHYNITRRRADTIEGNYQSLSIEDQINLIFAPSWELVAGYIRGQLGGRGAKIPDWCMKSPALTQDQYTAHYTRIVKQRLSENNQRRFLFVRDWLRGNCVITLSCECKPNEFCHRKIVADTMLRGIATQIGIPYHYAGEVSDVNEGKIEQLKLP